MMKYVYTLFCAVLVAALCLVSVKFAHAAPVTIEEVEFVTFPSNGSSWGLNMQDGHGAEIIATNASPIGDGRFEAKGCVVKLPVIGVDVSNATVSWTLSIGAWSDIRIITDGHTLVENGRRADGSTVAITFTHSTSKAQGQLRKIYEDGMSVGAIKATYK